MNQIFQKTLFKKQHKFNFCPRLKRVGLFVILLCIAGGGIFGYRYMLHKKSEQLLGNALQVEGYDAAKATTAIFEEDDCTNLAADLLHQVWPFLTEHQIVVSEEQKGRIKQELSELLIVLYNQGLITCDATGAWTDISKTYLANALSFAVLSVTGNQTIEKDQMIISDMTSTAALDQSVNDLKKRYQILINEIQKESVETSASNTLSDRNKRMTGNNTASSVSDYDLSNIKTQLTALQTAQNNNSKKMEAASQLALRMTALETLVNTIQNTKVPAAATNTASSASGNTEAYQKQIETRITELKKQVSDLSREMEVSGADTSDIEKKMNAIQQSISSLSGELTRNNSSNSNSKQELQKEITHLNAGLQEKQDAIETIQSQMAELERSAQVQKTEINRSIQDQKVELDRALQNQKTEIDRSVQDQKSQMNHLRDSVSKELMLLGEQLNEQLEKEVSDVRTNVHALVQEQQEQTAQWEEKTKNLICELEKNMENVVKEAEKKQTTSVSWLVDVVIGVSEWEAAEAGYIYRVSHQKIHEQYTNIYLTFEKPEELNDLSYVQKEGQLEIICPRLPEQEIVISTIKIENPI